MARPRNHLSNAPLREALIDIQFEPNIPIESIDHFVDALGAAVRTKSNIWGASFGVNMTANGQPLTTRSESIAVGRRLELHQGPYVLQCRVNGFTLSRLSPYGEWNDLRTEAHRLWGVFSRELGAVLVNRIAVRYINELRFPVPLRDFGEYLVSPPGVPDELPQGLLGFLTRVIIPDEANNCMTIVTQALEGPPSEGPAGATATVILDIDVFRAGTSDAPRSDEIWTALDTLRGQKNRVFFAHVTERTVEMYE